MNRIVLIGCGAMGGAILSGCLAGGVWKKEEVVIKGRTRESSEEKARAFGVSAFSSGRDIKEADLVLLAVKPQVLPKVLQELAKDRPKRVISIAAGVPLATLEASLPAETEVIRVMPNTPLSVGLGMSAIAAGKGASKEFLDETKRIFSVLGEIEAGSEGQLDQLGALSGAGPGYAFVMIDALADGGVRIGLRRELAIRAAAMALMGAAKLVLSSGRHPAALRDEVTSPGGTTIAGIHAMEEGGVRAALMNAVKAAKDRSDEMSIVNER